MTFINKKHTRTHSLPDCDPHALLGWSFLFKALGKHSKPRESAVILAKPAKSQLRPHSATDLWRQESPLHSPPHQASVFHCSTGWEESMLQRC